MRFQFSNEELLDQITHSFSRVPSETREANDLETWGAARGAILDVLNAIGPDHPLQVLRKVERLAYAHQNVMTEARIITELRPVFNDAGDTILQGIVVNTLLIDFNDGGHSRRIELGLDVRDVAALKRTGATSGNQSPDLEGVARQLGVENYILS